MWLKSLYFSFNHVFVYFFDDFLGFHLVWFFLVWSRDENQKKVMKNKNVIKIHKHDVCHDDGLTKAQSVIQKVSHFQVTTSRLSNLRGFCIPLKWRTFLWLPLQEPNSSSLIPVTARVDQYLTIES